MDDYVLVLNAGSSSLKFCVFERPPGQLWRFEARGQIEGIGTAPCLLVKDENGKTVVKQSIAVSEAHEALESLAAWLRSKYNRSRLLGVGHRVVHGGAHFTGPTRLNRDVWRELNKLVPLAPLHQPYNLAAIDAVFERLPGIPQVACFDTSFHRGHSAVVELIPLPRELRQQGLQRYGFHGLSYEYIASVLPEIAPKIADGRVIVAHLGSGSSLCALSKRKSVDTTLGFTALDGLCMGTRPGAIDPGVVLHLFQTLNFSAKEVETLLYKKSGLLGISGIANDMRELLGRNESAAKLAVDYFVYQATKEIGALAATLGGIDALVFTAGIGENSPEIRKRICESSAWLGIEIDTAANDQSLSEISTSNSKTSVWVVPTNEELMIARHTGLLLGLAKAA